MARPTSVSVLNQLSRAVRLSFPGLFGKADLEMGVQSARRTTDSIDMNYFDSEAGPKAQKENVVVMSFGAMGSHKDFKFITPLLEEKKIRVLAPNFPGHGVTKAPTDPEYKYSSDERAELVQNMLQKAGLKKVSALVSHSLGSFVNVALAAQEKFYTNNGEPISQALLLVNPGAARPYKVIRPYWLIRLFSQTAQGPLRDLSLKAQFLYWRYYWGIVSIKTEEQAAAISHTTSNIGFEKMRSLLRNLQNPGTPRVLIFYSEDDDYVEKSLSEEVSNLLGIQDSDRILVSDKKDIPQALEKIRKWWADGSRSKNAAIIFRNSLGGHYLQKFQASLIASSIEIISKNQIERRKE